MPDRTEPPAENAEVNVAEPASGALFEPYDSPAGGWGALQATAHALREQSIVVKGSKALLSMNQPDGFDCPGCAWPDPEAHELVRVLRERRQGGVVRADEATRHARVLCRAYGQRTRDAQRLLAGGARAPDRADALRARRRDHYVPVSWEDAFATDRPVAQRASRARTKRSSIRPAVPRTRRHSCIRFSCGASAPTISPIAPTCATRRQASACPRASASAKAPCCSRISTATDAIFVIGQNPGTNSPRMMTSLRNAARAAACRSLRSTRLRERALERFTAPQDPDRDVDSELDTASRTSTVRSRSGAMWRCSRA